MWSISEFNVNRVCQDLSFITKFSEKVCQCGLLNDHFISCIIYFTVKEVALGEIKVQQNKVHLRSHLNIFLYVIEAIQRKNDGMLRPTWLSMVRAVITAIETFSGVLDLSIQKAIQLSITIRRAGKKLFITWQMLFRLKTNSTVT